MLLQVSRSLLEAKVALLVSPPSTETDTNERRPCPSLEQEDGENDAETEAEGGLDEEVREAAIPLQISLVSTILQGFASWGIEELQRLVDWHTFSLRRASLTGREMALGWGRAADVSAIVKVLLSLLLADDVQDTIRALDVRAGAIDLIERGS